MEAKKRAEELEGEGEGGKKGGDINRMGASIGTRVSSGAACRRHGKTVNATAGMPQDRWPSRIMQSKLMFCKV